MQLLSARCYIGAYPLDDHVEWGCLYMCLKRGGQCQGLSCAGIPGKLLESFRC